MKKENKMPKKYRWARRFKCKQCGYRFESKTRQCPECLGVKLKERSSGCEQCECIIMIFGGIISLVVLLFVLV